jgi:linoleoyl-CoA desaturase
LNTKIKFKNKNESYSQFFPLLKKRVDSYFTENNIDKKANSSMVIKTIAMLLMYFIPFICILVFSLPFYVNLGLAIIWGFGLAGIGLSVMHDANHQAYSHNALVNKILGYTLNMVGGNAYTWQVQHNVLHHTYTNIHGHDEDLDAGIVVRFSKGAAHKSWHKFQHYYAFALYSLVTISWVVIKDLKKLMKYDRENIYYGQTTTAKELSIIIFSKLAYLAYTVAIPLMFFDVIWWQYLLCFLTMHLVAGVILSLIFQPAHVVGEADFPMPNDANEIENAWAVHELLTTANFARKNKILNWYAGGLNFQIEHHLFPTICHIHYEALAPIVKQTAEEFGLPYNEFDTFSAAIASHYHVLKELSVDETAIAA